MADEAPKLDYATPKANATPPQPALLVTGILLLIVGSVVFFIGVIAIGLDLRMGDLDYRSVTFAVLGALVCWGGMKMKNGWPVD